MPEPSTNLYFGYGSNLWLHQMSLRCPNSPFVGIAKLEDWRFIINQRGYATVVPSPGDHVWALVYDLTPEDEVRLDENEGVPLSYEKKYHDIALWDVAEENTTGRADVLDGGRTVSSLVYIDAIRTNESEPKHEYIYRMNMGIIDGIRMGIPQSYFDKYLRPFIPEKTDAELADAKPRVVE